MQAKSTVEVEGNQVRQNLRLVDLLEDHDDVQRVDGQPRDPGRRPRGGDGLSAHVVRPR